MLATPVAVRRRSVIIIGTQHSLDPQAIDADPEIQFHAADGLVNFYLPGYVQGGVQRLTSSVRGRFDRENRQVIEPFVNVREEVILALGKLASGGTSLEVRANGARAAGILRGKAAVGDLLQALHSKDTGLIFESLIALQKIQDVSAAPKLSFLLRDLEPRVQIAAIETTGLLRNTAAVPDLQVVFDSGRSEKVRRAALAALAMLAQQSSRPYFERALAQKPEGIRVAAAEGIARLKTPGDSEKMDKMFSEERNMAPRLAAAFALVSLGRVSTGQDTPLTYLVNALNSKAQQYALAYLYELGREGVVRKTLYEYLKAANREEKMGIGQILAMSGGAGAVETLEWLPDPDPEVAQAGVRSLRSLKTRIP
ncbi:MAG: HEAT repeat domain-containing protein [Bryobacteraceae bacterium]